MRTTKLLVVAGFLAGLVFVILAAPDAEALSRGPFLERSGAPGEQTCVACHRTYPINSGAGRVEILDLPAQYQPGQTYPVRVRVSDPLASEWGFQITAVADDGSAAGFFQTESQDVQALGPSQRYGRFYAEHTIFGVYPGQRQSAEWRFLWKAPYEDLGPVTFYATGNAANGDHTDFYDYIYSTAVSIDGQRRIVRVRLVAPVGGDRLGAGERATISWSASDGDDAVAAGFRVLLSTDGGENFPSVIADDLPASARGVVWSVPDALETESARIRVVAIDSLGVEHADASRSDIRIGPLGLDARPGAISVPSGAPLRAARFADYDSDGRADAAIARSAGGVLLLRGAEDGTFTDATAGAGLTGSGDVRAVAWGDFDADSRPDLAVVSVAAIAIYRNDGQGHFTIVGAPTSLPRPADPHAAVWRDVDSDGRADLLVGSSTGVVALRSAGEGGFEDATALWGLGSTDVEALAAGPLVAVGGASGLRLLAFEGGRYVDVTARAGASVAGVVEALAWVDVTGDGVLDLVVGTESGARVLAAEGGDGARYRDRTADVGLAISGAVTAVAAGDYDADGLADLFLVANGSARIYRHRPAGGFADVTDRFALGAGTVSAAWVDLDDSATVDLVALAPQAAAVLTNPRSGTATVRVRPRTGGVAAAGARVAVDLDGDGDWSTGAKAAVLLEGGEETALVAAPGLAATLVRVSFGDGHGRQLQASTGGDALVADDQPAPDLASALVKGAKLVLDGAGLAASGARIEVGGAALERTKAPKRFQTGDGLATRLVGRDPHLASLVSARPVAVRVFDPATGVFTRGVLVQ